MEERDHTIEVIWYFDVEGKSGRQTISPDEVIGIKAILVKYINE